MPFVPQLCIRGPVGIWVGEGCAFCRWGQHALFSVAGSGKESSDNGSLGGSGSSCLWLKGDPVSSETVRDSCGLWGEGRSVGGIPLESSDVGGLSCSTKRLSLSFVGWTSVDFASINVFGLDDHSDGRLSCSWLISGSGSDLAAFSYLHTIDNVLNRLAAVGLSCPVLALCSRTRIPVPRFLVLGCRVRKPNMEGAVLLARALPPSFADTVCGFELDLFRVEGCPG